ncbi:MAG: metallophosphoesterase [Calditrichaeota bacterium]|nr:MAG: metallophosphoesterase [Calditrichota bacterium]
MLRIILMSLIFLQLLITGSFAGESDKWNDGPYVFINDDTTFLVQYVDSDSLIQFEVSGDNSVSFQGSVYDSGNNYIVYRNHIVPKTNYTDISKLFVFSDIHGEYEFLCELLINNHVIDSSLHWSFGDGHLVVDGDVFDRGDKVNEILWMLYRLEKEAEEAGGMVHYLLGNHEIMPIQNDIRYINENYATITCSLLNKSYPELYSNQSVIGNWIRSKNVCEIINGILFVHGGMNPDFIDSGLTIDIINETMRENIDKNREEQKEDSVYYFYSGYGPVWYRGFHYEMEKYPQATEADIDKLLNFYNVEHIIVGHTVVDSVSSLYDGKIFAVNQDYTEHDEIEGMFWEDGVFYACDISGKMRKLFEKR